MRPSFFHHLHPPTIPAPQARLRYTLGAGGFSVFLLLVVILTGALELFYYVPTPAEAALSLQTLTFLVPYGGLVRNLHYWSAQLLVVTALVHLLRVIFSGAYSQPRRFNYWLGLGLLVLLLFLDFTGYALRWDVDIHWALVAGTNLLGTIPLIGDGLYRLAVGGTQIGAATLLRFYAWHIFGLTLALGIGVGWHIFRLRRDGGLAVPPPELRSDARRITRFELVRREAVAALFCAALLVWLAAFFPAPLAAPLQEAGSLTGAARAPWFFLWVQQLLRWGDAFLYGVVVPSLVLALLAGLPYLLPGPAPHELGRWFPRGGRATQIVVAGLVVALLLLTWLAWLPAAP